MFIIEHLDWIPTVHTETEAVVAEEALQPAWHLFHDLSWDGKQLILLRSKIANPMTHEKSESLPVIRNVGAAGVSHGPLPHDH